ncbi:MAG TPA: HAD-IIB family hydrolase [Candidatus Saccharimonadales bacterium]|nr:HAD-IIB family hydrolase [Candidatus Saccharimonadales bacterium]
MQITDLSQIKNKDLIVFDLDGTLAPTKSTIDQEMSKLLEDLLNVKKVAVIGGGKMELFQEQLLDNLKVPDESLKNLFLFPTTATTFYKHENGEWKQIYFHKLSQEEVDKIMAAFDKVLKEVEYKPEKTYGKIIENRGSQITWSALGQDVVKVLGDKGVELKNEWRNENTPLKLKIAKMLQEELPNLEVHAAGYTSIDITKPGIDKAYGLHQIEEYLGIKIENMLFVGDAIFEGGNDYAITKTPVDYVQVKDTQATKEVIKSVLLSS